MPPSSLARFTPSPFVLSSGNRGGDFLVRPFVYRVIGVLCRCWGGAARLRFFGWNHLRRKLQRVCYQRRPPIEFAMRVWRVLRVSGTTDSELQSTTGTAVCHSAPWQ